MGESRRRKQGAAVVQDKRGDWFPVLLPLLLFLAVTAISGQFAVGFVAAALILTVGKEPLALAGRRATLLTLAVIVYGGLYLCSGLWSHFGAYAQEESVKTLIALTMFGLVLFRLRQEKLRSLLWSLDGVLGVVGLLCIDASSLKALSRVFSALMKLFRSNYALESMGYESGIRITGIYANANVSAGILAFGLILSLYLFQTEEKERPRLIAGVLLGVQALAFFLSFSMGAMGAFAVTCLVYLLCAGKGSRLRLFLLMVESVLVTLVCAFGAYAGLGKEGAAAVLPVLLAFVCGLLIWALDHYAGLRLVRALENRGRAVGVAAAALVVLMAVYAVLAMTVTGGTTLTAGESLSRAVALKGGDYTVAEMTWEQSVSVRIYSQNDKELMMHTETVLYEGDLSQAAFTVPEDSKAVWFVMQGEGALDRVILSDGTKVPLGYKLLPGFAANRLQALWANQNFIQRLVFFRDGLKLWWGSPVFGWGAGGVEGQLTSVQSFYYESKYIHNQFIQIMDEAGLLGLAAFLFLLGSAIWTLVRRRKEERDPMFAMLAACLTMMVSHSLTEVVWSTQMYQVVVFVLFGVEIIRYGRPQEDKGLAVKARLAAGALGAVVVVFALLQGGNILAYKQFVSIDNSISQAEFLSALGRMDFLDVYDDTTYRVNRMANALQSGESGIAAQCAQKLMAKQEYDACYYVATYYYLPLRELPEFFRATRIGLAQEASNQDAWNGIFKLYRQAFDQLTGDEMEDFLTGAAETGAYLEEFNVGRMEEIVLSEENQQFLDGVLQARQAGLTGEEAYAFLESALAQ